MNIYIYMLYIYILQLYIYIFIYVYICIEYIMKKSWHWDASHSLARFLELPWSSLFESPGAHDAVTAVTAVTRVQSQRNLGISPARSRRMQRNSTMPRPGAESSGTCDM